MAGLGRRTFAAGEVLTASNVMGYLQDQAVMNFAGTAARGTALGTAVSEGMVSYLADTNVVQAYDGAAWNSLAYQSAVAAIPTVGLIPAVPTSVDKTGGTATANSLGVVTFSGVSGVSLNNVFTSAYRNYRIMINFTGFSANNDVFLRLRKGGTDSSASYTYAGNTMNTANSGGSWVANGNSLFHLSSNLSTYANRSRNFVEVFGPQQSIFTNVFWNSFHDNGTIWNHTTVSGCHTVTDNYDGVTLYPSTGTITGFIQVFGYNG